MVQLPSERVRDGFCYSADAGELRTKTQFIADSSSWPTLTTLPLMPSALDVHGPYEDLYDPNPPTLANGSRSASGSPPFVDDESADAEQGEGRPDEEGEDDGEEDLDDIEEHTSGSRPSNDVGSDSSKNKRFRLTHNQTRFLMSEFARQPHPDAVHRERLSSQIPGLSPRQVQVWFQNRRAKLKRLTSDDRERMLRARALPDDFDSSHALRSPLSDATRSASQPMPRAPYAATAGYRGMTAASMVGSSTRMTARDSLGMGGIDAMAYEMMPAGHEAAFVPSPGSHNRPVSMLPPRAATRGVHQARDRLGYYHQGASGVDPSNWRPPSEEEVQNARRYAYSVDQTMPAEGPSATGPPSYAFVDASSRRHQGMSSRR